MVFSRSLTAYSRILWLHLIEKHDNSLLNSFSSSFSNNKGKMQLVLTSHGEESVLRSGRRGEQRNQIRKKLRRNCSCATKLDRCLW